MDVAKQRENNDKTPGGVTGKGFVPGQSGNPSGRPRGSVSLVRILREKLSAGDEAAAVAIVDAMIREAKDGDFRHAQEILNRIDGKVPDRIAGPEGEPLSGDLSRLSTDELVAFRALLAKLAGRSG